MKHWKLLRGLMLAFAMVALAACTSVDRHHDDHDHDHEHEHEAGEFGRLLVYRTDGSLVVLDAGDGDVLATFAGVLPAGPAVVDVSHSGEFAYVRQVESGRVALVDSGFHLESHGGHYDLDIEDPALLEVASLGGRSGAFASSRGLSLLYNADDGALWLLEEEGLRQAVRPSSLTARSGGAEIILTSDDILVAYKTQAVVEILRHDGQVKQSLSGGRNVAGQARFGRFFAFGVEEGLLLLAWQGDYSAKILPLPAGLPAGARINRMRGHALVPYIVAGLNTGPFLVKASLTTDQLTLARLPVEYIDFGFDQSGKYLAVLGTDGRLYSLHPESLEILGSLKVAAAVSGQSAPLLSLGKAHAWVADPVTGQIVMVALDELEIEARFQLPAGAPIGGMALMLTEGTRH
jgi:hypothetical protein